jgi:hypothetical protein
MKSKNSSIAMGVSLGVGYWCCYGCRFQEHCYGSRTWVAIGTALGAGMYQKAKKEEEGNPK